MFRGCAFQRNDLVQQLVQLRELGLAELPLHPRVMRFDGVRQLFDQLQSFRGGLDDGAALVGRVALAAHEPVALHACQHAGEAGAEDVGLAPDAAGFHRAVLAEHTQHAPLLVRQAVAAQAGARVRHDGLARLQQQSRQVAVLERGGSHGAGHYLRC